MTAENSHELKCEDMISIENVCESKVLETIKNDDTSDIVCVSPGEISTQTSQNDIDDQKRDNSETTEMTTYSIAGDTKLSYIAESPVRDTSFAQYSAEDIPICNSLSSISDLDYEKDLLQLEECVNLVKQDDFEEEKFMMADVSLDLRSDAEWNSMPMSRYAYGRVASLAPALESKPPSYMWLALFTIFFNFVLGLIALVIAMQSDHEYWKENIDRARKLGRIVKVICILAIVTTCLTIVVISIVFSSSND